jgi:folate-binding protein YgfZ
MPSSAMSDQGIVWTGWDGLASGAVILAPAAANAWQVIRATGGDRLTFLHRLLTASVETLQPGQGQQALLLNIKGHVVAELRVCVRPDDVWLLVPPGQGEAAAAALSRYAIMDDVTLALQGTLDVLAIHGPRATAALAAVGIEVPSSVSTGALLAHAEVADAGAGAGRLSVIQAPGLGSAGFWLVGERDVITQVTTRLRAADVGELGPEVVEGLRIAAGEPKFGVEITPEVFPMEVGLDGMIDYGKGCYLGQEPIVRIRDRGHVNRRLVGLRLPADAAVAAEATIETDERPKAGRVTSAARLPGGPVALALVHVSVPLGATVRVRQDDGAIEAVVIAASAGTRGGPADGPATP